MVARAKHDFQKQCQAHGLHSTVAHGQRTWLAWVLSSDVKIPGEMKSKDYPKCVCVGGCVLGGTNKVYYGRCANGEADCETVGFFFKIGVAWGKAARANLNTQKYGLFCSVLKGECGKHRLF